MAHVNIRASEEAYHFAGLPRICAYCNDPADTIDHTVPCWFVSGNLALISRSKLFKVHCCRDCNLRAGRVVDRTFIERKRRIATALRRAHRSILGVAHWPEDEMLQLRYRLRTYVRSGSTRRAHLIERLLALESPLVPHGMCDELMFNIDQAGE